MKREILFISKATPGDDEFVLWLAPRLEAAGYTVFADILNLEPGDRWRKEVTGTLQNKAIKMLLCCRDSTLEKNGVQEEIGIAEDVVKELQDPRFIIPLRLEKFKKVFGIGELQYVNFLGSWASGLRDLLDTFGKQNVPRSTDNIVINPNWENYKKRLAIRIEDRPEVLTMNWLRVASVPDFIRYYQPTGAVNHLLMQRACKEGLFPAEIHLRGFFSFAAPEEIERDFSSVGRFALHSEHELMGLLENGSDSPNIRPRQVQNLVSSMFRKSWENLCRAKGLHEYAFSNQLGFHVTENQVPLGKKISWGREGQRRFSMLRNTARGKAWQYGVSAAPYFWPFPHFKIKARVLFADIAVEEGMTAKVSRATLCSVEQQHRLRRSICKGWRNKAWHGRFRAFLLLLSNNSPLIEPALSASCLLKVSANPVFVRSPITTILPDIMSDEAEEIDVSTFGNSNVEDEE